MEISFTTLMVTMTIVITMNTGTMAIGFMHHTVTIVVISFGGIRGGGIGIGGDATGAITGLGISSTLATMWFGTTMDAGGIGHATAAT
jgi:hypothetical protein